jgi:HTH-type transcriptional repressor of NAD biosynthesis genes
LKRGDFLAKRGLVIGKFYPPHRGHKYLIDTAQSQSDELWVIVCGRPEEAPSGELRAAWLKEIHPEANVLLIDDQYDPDDSKLWAEMTLGWLGFAPDTVFTSEEYGEHYARYLGCQHIQVDKARLTFPISGTQIRENPLAGWEFLEPPVRAYYARRVCIVGAESTGKTTLAPALAAHYRTIWVAEYGRDYSERKLADDGCYNWSSPEFAHIARTQCEIENAKAREANRVLICDTDAFATSIWHRRYMGEPSREVEEIAANHRRPDLYLLTDVDTPFVQDGTRDGERIREWMHKTFIEELTTQNRPFRLLSGSLEERLQQAIGDIDELLGG